MKKEFISLKVTCKSLVPLFLYLDRLHGLIKLYNFACNCIDFSISDEHVSNNEKYHPFHYFFHSFSKDVLNTCCEPYEVVLSSSYYHPQRWRWFKNADHWSFLPSVLSRSIPFSETTSHWTLVLQLSQHFPFLCFITLWSHISPRLLEHRAQLSLKSTEREEIRKGGGGKLMAKAIHMAPPPQVQQVLWYPYKPG